MIFLYEKSESGGQKDAVEEIIRFLEKDSHTENARCGTLEECIPYLRRDSSVMDLRMVQKYIVESPDYCEDRTVDEIFSLIDPVDSVFSSVKGDTVYILLLPESDINSNEHISDSLVSNLNMLKDAGLKPIPLARSFTRGHPKVAYSFTMIARNALTAARYARNMKIKGWE